MTDALLAQLPLISEVDWPPYAVHRNHPDAHCWVYEVWDDRNRLVYVGIAEDFERRWRQHVAKSWWLGEVVVDRVFVFGYRTRDEAHQVEACTINEQHPVYNTSLEAAAYRRYRGLSEDPERPTDEFDCAPVKKRWFEGRAA